MALTNQWPAGVDGTAAVFNTRSIPVVTSTADITAPFTGQVIFNTTDNMLYRYTGSAWLAFTAVGGSTAATLHEVRYEQRTLQAIANATDTKIKFDTAVTTSNDVTPSGTGNTDFALNRAGLWVVTASLRYVAATANERHIFLLTGTTIGTLANRFASQTVVNVGTAPAVVSTTSAIRVTAGTSVCAGAWQNNGSSVNTDVAFGGTNHISFTWLRP